MRFHRCYRRHALRLLAWAFLVPSFCGASAGSPPKCEDYSAYLHWVGSASIGVTLDVAVQGSYLFAACGDAGLKVLDISQPTEPQLLGVVDTPGYAYGVHARGSLVFVADRDSGLQIVDVSTPGSPELIGSADTPGSAFGVNVLGDYAYVADHSGGIQVVNISDPRHPGPIGKLAMPGLSFSIAIQGSTGYVASWNAGLVTLDLSTPASPYILGRVSTQDYAKDVDVWGDRAFVADYYGGLRVVNVSDPTSPKISGFLITPDANGVTVKEELAFVADDDSGLMVIDVSTDSPILIGQVATYSAWKIAVTEDYAFIADLNYGIQIFDVRRPVDVQESGNVSLYQIPLNILASNSTAFVFEDLGHVEVVDLSNPRSPIVSGTMTVPWYSASLDPSDDYMYIASTDCTLVVVDAGILPPSEIAAVKLPDYAYDVTVSGAHAYVAAWNAGLQVVDISQPGAPTVVASVATLNAFSVKATDDLVCLGGLGGGLTIFDVSTPTSPKQVSFLDVNPVLDIDAVYPYVYAATLSGFFVIDVSLPTSPQVLSQRSMRDAYRIKAVRNLVYVSDLGGLTVMDVSNPTAPAVLGGKGLPAMGYSVEVDDKFVYLGEGRRGDPGCNILHILPRQCSSPNGLTIHGFAAWPRGNAIEVSWQLSRTDNLPEFLIYRSPAGEDHYEPNTAEPHLNGMSMWALDTDIAEATEYRYCLAAIYAPDDSVWYGPVTASVASFHFVTALRPGIPNPSLAGGAMVTIPFSAGASGDYALTLFDMTGRPIRSLLKGHFDPGDYTTTWDGRDDQGRPVASGVYVCTLTTHGFRASRKMVRLR